MTDLARKLILSAYPIPHDEGCMLDPEFGEHAFEDHIDEEMDKDENFDPYHAKKFCNCGTDELNREAEQFLASFDTI